MIQQYSKITVKLVWRGHHRDKEKVAL